MQNQLTNAKQPGGLVGTLMVMGLAAGFAIVDLRAALAGYNWANHRWVRQTIVSAVIGALSGLIAGVVLDRNVTAASSRSRLLRTLWICLAVGVLLFALIEPAFQRARE